MQPIFVGDYLTTEGQIPEADYAMIRNMGFEVAEPSREKTVDASGS